MDEWMWPNRNMSGNHQDWQIHPQTCSKPSCYMYLTLKVLNFWKFTSYCSLKPLWPVMGEVVPVWDNIFTIISHRSHTGSYLADTTSPIPSHCASIVATSTLRVKKSGDVWLFLRYCLVKYLGLARKLGSKFLFPFTWFFNYFNSSIVYLFSETYQGILCRVFEQTCCTIILHWVTCKCNTAFFPQFFPLLWYSLCFMKLKYAWKSFLTLSLFWWVRSNPF